MDGCEVYIRKREDIIEGGDSIILTHAAVSTTSGLIMLPPQKCSSVGRDRDTA
jgi:hypothetical protein